MNEGAMPTYDGLALDLFADLGVGVNLGFATVGADFAQNAGGAVDEHSTAVIDGVAAQHAAVDDLGPFQHDQITADVAVDVHAAAVGDLEIAVDRAADVHLAAIHDGDVSGDDPPQIHAFGDDLVAVERAAFFAHGNALRHNRQNCKSTSADRGWGKAKPFSRPVIVPNKQGRTKIVS